MWFDLACQYFRLIKGTNPPKTLADSIAKLCQYRKTQDFSSVLNRETRRQSNDRCDDAHVEDGDMSEHEIQSEFGLRTLIPNEPLLNQLLWSVLKFRNSSFMSAGKASQDSHVYRSDPLSISHMSQRIRQALDHTLCNSPTPECHKQCANILERYGPRPFKCRVPQCEFWQYGFPNFSTRETHEQSHDKPLKCNFPGCEFGLIGFLSEKLRRDHTNRAHRSDSLEPSFDTRNLLKNNVQITLSNLVRENLVGPVRKVLSECPNALETAGTRQTLQFLAARHASYAILKMLEKSNESSVMNLLSEPWKNRILQSISGKNESTLDYFLSRLNPFTSEITGPAGSIHSLLAEDTKLRSLLLIRLVSDDWDSGMKVYTRWLHRGLHLFPENGLRLAHTRNIFSQKPLITAAASHPAGYQQLLHLWEELGGLSTFSKGWANTALRNVAEVGFSIPLASYLLKQGADINKRQSIEARTALECAAKSTSLEAARMVEFLLLNGANPGESQVGKNICEEKGAKGIHRWLDVTWDELVKKTKRIRDNRERERLIISTIGQA
ncbi:hypothetical protein F5B18DRAFT_209830 [Nemania serpens]|nr:hypothetical protein F5B18DRAFT_209830 [Nemania serpens]